MLICCSGERVVSRYMARSGNSRAWSALMSPIPAPEVVVTDGGSGFARAVLETWPRTRVQRCTFHAFSQVKRYTTTRPKLQAGRELYLIARDLMGIETLHQAELWVERYLDWCGFWADFLEDRTVVDGRRACTRERLRRARSSLSSPVSAGTLFTYLDPALAKAGPLPSTNNMVEGGVNNSQPGAVLRNHRGLTSVKRVKAVFGGAARARGTRGRRAGVGRQGRVGGPPPQGPVPVLAGLMDGNGCSIGTHILSYKPKNRGPIPIRIGPLNNQLYCCQAESEILLLFSDSPHSGFHHFTSCTADWCNGIDDFSQRILWRYCMLMRRERRGRYGSFRFYQHAYE